MTYDVAIFGNNMVIPDHVKGDHDPMAESLAGNGGGLRISIKGNVFRMLKSGKEIQRSEDRHLNVVLVNAAPENSRTFYSGGYKDGEKKPPACWSSDGKTPDTSIKTPQGASCATCPKNVAGSGSNGKSRACRYYRQMALALEGDLEGPVYKLSLPAESIFGKLDAKGKASLQAYAESLRMNKVHMNKVVTEMRFDLDSPTPKLTFKVARFLTPQEVKISEQQGQTPEALEAIRLNVFQQDEKGAASEREEEPFETGGKPVTASPTLPVVAGITPEMMAQLMESLGKRTEPATEEPTVKKSKKAETPKPASGVDMLKQWDDDDNTA